MVVLYTGLPHIPMSKDLLEPCVPFKSEPGEFEAVKKKNQCTSTSFFKGVMRVMGLIDEMEMSEHDNFPCPISDEQVAMLTTANSHMSAWFSGREWQGRRVLSADSE